ncbi:MAG: 2-dehydro-3-deoxygalactonokinase, partial [Pseudomonadota bacterium]
MTAEVRPDWIAVDWGTSCLRGWAMQGGTALARAESPDGMGTLSRDQFEPALLRLIGDWLGDHEMTVLCCGMVGSRQGWVEAPYHAVPAKPIDAKPVSVPRGDPRIRAYVLPGLRQNAPADVMRGEETQIAGFIALNPGWDGVICLPGTHTKWAEISAGEVVSFQTFMTGEMFALLGQESVLRHSVGSDGWDAVAFVEAIADAIARPERLAAQLFSVRARDLLEGTAPAVA